VTPGLAKQTAVNALRSFLEKPDKAIFDPNLTATEWYYMTETLL
jgi:hypothetical protein